DRLGVAVVEANDDRLARVRSERNQHLRAELAELLPRGHADARLRIGDLVGAETRAVAAARARARTHREAVTLLRALDDAVPARLEIAGVADAVAIPLP